MDFRLSEIDCITFGFMESALALCLTSPLVRVSDTILILMTCLTPTNEPDGEQRADRWILLPLMFILSGLATLAFPDIQCSSLGSSTKCIEMNLLTEDETRVRSKAEGTLSLSLQHRTCLDPSLHTLT